MDLDHELELEDVEDDPSVPTELLDLHVHLEDANVTPEAFKEAYKDDASNKS